MMMMKEVNRFVNGDRDGHSKNEVGKKFKNLNYEIHVCVCVYVRTYLVSQTHSNLEGCCFLNTYTWLLDIRSCAIITCFALY